MPRPVANFRGQGFWRTFCEWFNEPHDYDWIKHQRSSRALMPILRMLVGLITMIFGLSAFFKLIGPAAPTTTAGTILSISMITGSVIMGICWLTLPFPGRRGLITFGICANLAIASSVLLVPERAAATFGCIIFSVAGTYSTLFVSAKWLVAQVLWSTGITAVVFALACFEGELDTTTLLARASVLFGIVTLVPIFSHLTWRTLYRDARYSDRDPLTGLYNRRGLEAAANELFEKACSEATCLAFVVVDIDKFKLVNDAHGHSEGDQVIIRTANRLGTYLGEHGVIARVGGEEYLAVIAGEPNTMSVLVKGVNAAVSEHPDSIPTTVSVGAVFMPADSKAWSGGASAILAASNIADSMMYQAKATGGNSVRTTQI